MSETDTYWLELEAGTLQVGLVKGPHPYIWIGTEDRFLACTDTEQLRAFRDEITKALRHALREAS